MEPSRMSPAEFDLRSPMPTRTRPRLFKARKHLHRKSSRTAVSADPEVEGPAGKVSSSNGVSCSGFVFGAGSTPEGLGPVNGTSLCAVNSGSRVCEAREAENEGSGFVFRAGRGTGVELNKDFNRREDGERVEASGGSDAAFVFGSSWLDSRMRKLNINGGTQESSLKDGDDNVFVFGSTGNVHASSFENGLGCFRSGEGNGSQETGGVIPGSESFVFKAEWGSSAEVQSSQDHVEAEIRGGVAASFEQSVDMGFDATYFACRPANMDRMEAGSCERKSPDGFRAPFTEFQPPQWDPSRLKESLFTVLQKTPNFDVKSESKMDKSIRKSRRKLKQPSLSKQKKAEDHLQNASNTSSPSYSPMDFSPYGEATTDDQFSKDSPLTNNMKHLDRVDAQPATPPTGYASRKDMEGLTHGKESSNFEEPREDISGHCNERCCAGSDSSNGLIFFADKSSSDSIFGEPCKKKGVKASTGSERMESNHSQQFCFTSGLVDADTGKCSSSSSSMAKFPPTRRFRRKKYRKHVLSEPFIIAPRSNSQDQGEHLGKVEIGNVSEFDEQVHVVITPSADELQEACETWRLRGNRVFKNGDLSKAEEFYSHGIDIAASCEVPGYCLKPLVICYSNRAAARMSLGNMRDAVSDCEKAAILDPYFLKVQLRAANCHLLLGEVENALNYYTKCLESPAGVCLDRRITIEAADNLQKAQKVADCITSAAKLLEQKTPDAALCGLDITAEALSISPHSERLLEIKSWFLFLLCKYDEVIQLCEHTLGAAEKNFVSLGCNEHSAHVANPKSESYSFARLWRWHLISKSYFYTGRLEKALDLLEKLQEWRPLSFFTKELKTELEAIASLSVTIRDLLNHKNAGNLAVQSGRYAEAVEHYSTALSSNLQARPFAAICFCNRAAGYQALGQIADAIADCSLAISLNKKYTKALARRATLHEMIRDYGQAASDLRRFISIIENQSDKKDGKSGTDGQSPSTKELRQAQWRLRSLEEEAKNGISLDFYLILGVKEFDSASDVKKAYRKAALRHHPDKASQYLARSDGRHEGQIWKAILQEVHADADKLFKIIGEAYSVLSDPSKRQEYDLDEENMKMKKQKGKSSVRNRTSESHGFPFERSNQRRNSQDNWKTYGNSYGHYYR